MAVGGDSATPRVAYILAELEDLDGVFVPVKTASRVKYTSFDVSRHYIVFGTTAGGVIMLQQDSLAYLKTITVKEGPICQVALAPDENIVGFATSRGIAIVMEHNADRSTTQPQRLQVSYEHKGALITGMQWNVSSSKLFVGDDKGKVSIISVTTSRTRNIFQIPTSTLMKLDSKVVQLDYAQDHLLVSTMTRCYLCDTTREQFLQVGKKLRDGEYGACFYPGVRSVDPCTIFSARPGSRMWEVDIKGNVQCTHQFKQALAISPEKLFTFRREVVTEEVEKEFLPQSVAFNRMLLLWPNTEDSPFIFTWSQSGAYVFDSRRAEIILWNDELQGIRDARCYRGDVYIHFLDGRFSKYTLMTVENAVCRLYQLGLIIHGAQLILLKQASLCAARLNIHVPPSFLLDILQKVSDLGRSYLFSSLSAVLSRFGLSSDKLSQSSRSSSAMSEPVRLGSGIYVVNKFPRDFEEDCQAPVCLSRWRSASPVFRHTSGSPHSSPSRLSDRSLSSPRRQRSGTLPSVTLKEKGSKIKSALVSRGSGYGIRTPDSVDSGTSGRTSDMSDETQSSPSFKEDFQKDSLQTLPPSAKLYDNHKCVSWTELCYKHNADELKSALEMSSGDDETLIVSQEGSQISLMSTNEKSLSAAIAYDSGLSSGLTLNGDECSEVTKSNVIDSNQTITLNLSDLSKEINNTGKRVSFKTKVFPSESHEISVAKQNMNLKQSLNADSSESSKKSELTNFTDIKEKKNQIGQEEIFNSIYPDSLLEDTYGLMNMTLYGGMMMPNMDVSFLIGDSGADFNKFKESLSNKLTAGKNILLRNLKDLELRIKQSQDLKPELLDVKSKNKDDVTSVSPCETPSEYDLDNKSLDQQQDERNFWLFLPPIDTTELIEITEFTRIKLRDPIILLNKDELHHLLENWINILHESQKIVLQAVNKFRQTSHTTSHSYRDDDTLKSTCSQGTSPASSPSEDVDENDKENQEESSTTEVKSWEDKPEDLGPSLNLETSESSTLVSESVQGTAVNFDDFVFIHDPFRLSSENHRYVADLALMCFQLKVWGKLSELKETCSSLEKKKDKNEDVDQSILKSTEKINIATEALVLNSELTQIGVSDIKKDIELLTYKFHGKHSDTFYSPRNISKEQRFDTSNTSKLHEFASDSLSTQNSNNICFADLQGDTMISKERASEKRFAHIFDSSSKIVQEDISSAVFVQNYFHLLDMYRIRELLIMSNKPCIFTWHMMLQGATASSTKDEFTQKITSGQIEAAAKALERGFSGAILVSHILKIFKSSPSRAVELCLHRSYHITPLDVLYLSRSSDTYPESFLTYVAYVIDCLPDMQRPRVLNKLLHHEEVRWEWITGIFLEGKCTTLKCSCGWPRPGSHLFSWQHTELVLYILATSESIYDKLLALCFHFGFWKGYLLLAKKLQLYEVHHRTVIHLADISLLSSKDTLGYLPTTTEEWKQLMHIIAKQQSVPGCITCITCGEHHQISTTFVSNSEDSYVWKATLNWEMVARIALMHLGPLKALALLQETVIPVGCFSPQFYKSFILSFLMDKQQSALSHRMLTTIGNYLWSRRPVSLSPEVHQLFQKEKQKPVLADAQETENGDHSFEDRTWRCYLEEPESHWGTVTCMRGFCQLCKMSVTSHLSSSSGGVTIYACGHTYHTACLPEGFCIACVTLQHEGFS